MIFNISATTLEVGLHSSTFWFNYYIVSILPLWNAVYFSIIYDKCYNQIVSLQKMLKHLSIDSLRSLPM